MFYKYYGRWLGRGLSSGQSQLLPACRHQSGLAASSSWEQQYSDWQAWWARLGWAARLLAMWCGVSANREKYKIISFLQLVVGWLKDHHFSFERFSNKLHMETTMELSTGRGPSEELWSMSCQCAAVISSATQFYFHHLDVGFKDTRIKCQFSDRLQCILPGPSVSWCSPSWCLSFRYLHSAAPVKSTSRVWAQSSGLFVADWFPTLPVVT